MLTTNEAAARLGVSRKRVLALITAGRLKATRFGRDWAIEVKALEAVMDRKAGYPKGKPRKKYITLDAQGQLATGPDWDAGMAEGQREMAEALERDKARETERERAHYLATHCDQCGQELSYDDCGCARQKGE